MMRRRAHLAGIALIALAPVIALAPAGVHAFARPGVRTVGITIHYSHFSLSDLRVEPGETVRFVVQNTDPIDHEFILGDQHIQDIHENGTEAYHPPRPGEMTVPAGTTRVTTYTFPTGPTQLIFGCHLPGHYAYGMHGLVTVGS
jgi:uncharacterized cupredoxin-like copper-binding protein